ncbi:SRPBCC family protein [Streptomyces hygroscopicus]|uniref:SRPBCC family protein n=1 Tax=Streptomyces hygroscopicus TaxID=1912 RepID=UPI0037F18ADB
MDQDFGVTGSHTEVELLVDVPADRLWKAITDLSRIGDWSPECTYAGWLDGWSEPVVGARFEARNRFAGGLVTQVVCLVVAADRPFSFGWKVFGGSPDTEEHFAAWHYELRPAEQPDRTVVRQSFTHGPGDSRARAAVRADPGNAAALLRGRLDQLRRNMAVTIEAMVRDIRNEGA